MDSLIEGSLTIGGLFTAFPVSYWTMKTFEPKEAVSPATVEHPCYAKAVLAHPSVAEVERARIARPRIASPDRRTRMHFLER